MSGAAPRIAQAQPALIYADQGPQWTTGARRDYYTQDQGSQLIPLSWLAALRSADGKAFLDGSLARYGYLPNLDPSNKAGLPVGFSLANSDNGQMVGMTCSACHTRQIEISGQPYRVDGGPAIADFETFLLDLDASTLAVLADAAKFDAFAAAVLAPGPQDAAAAAVLRADLTVWSVRFHTLMSRALPKERLWGPARLDAVSMIFNRVTGLDLGTSPTYVMADNIVLANAPTRYPFLWNASRQDHTQWPGFAPNGNDLYALSRNLGEVYGVFGMFHPEQTTGSAALFDRNYVVRNSANFGGLWKLEGLIKRIGPPAWQWTVDQPLAARGKTIYENVKTGPNGGASCNDCHGIHENYGFLNYGTWKTPIQNVGTDQAEWRVLGRYASTGSLEGASIPEVQPTMLAREQAISILKISVAGAIGEHGVSSFTQDITASAVQAPTNSLVLGSAAPMNGMAAGAPNPAAIAAASPLPTIITRQSASASLPQLNSLFRVPGMRPGPLSAALGAPPPVNAYESRVLQGIWAAAPYLHNGSVPTLADLLKPAAQRPKSFAVGPAYDLATVGLAATQPGSSFTLQTAGCDAAGLITGDSNCGHEYGTALSPDDKKALLEYLKTL